MSTPKSKGYSVIIVFAFSLSAFLYLNLGTAVVHEPVSGILVTEKKANTLPPAKVNAGLLPEVDLIKDTYAKLKEIKPLFE